MENLIGIVLLATFIEGLISYIFGGADGKERAWIKYITLIVGVIVSLLYKVDIFAMVGLTAINPIVGYIMSGLVIGRGSNYLNDFIGLMRKS